MRSLLIALAALTAAAASGPLVVKQIDTAGYAALVGDRQGRPLVVNMWATWCDPCREEFPELVSFHEAMAPRGVDVTAVSLDMADVRETAVIPFLRAQKVVFPTYMKTAGGDEEFINGVDPGWSGALPATFIYDGQGRLKHRILGATTAETLTKAVAPLLKGAPD